MQKSSEGIEPIRINEAHLFFDLHGVLISKEKLITKYDEYIVKFIKDQQILPPNTILKSVKLANTEWAKFWKQAKELSEKKLVEEYEKANTLWAETIFQGEYKADYRQLAEFLEYYIPTQFCCIYPEIKVELNRLKHQGVKLSITSSAYTRHTLGVLVGCSILQYFSNIIGLENTNSLKSDINYYLRTMEIAQSTPQKSIFFGNSFVEMALPKSLGMKVVFVNREIADSQKIDEAISYADLVVPNLENISSKLIEAKILY